MPTPDKNENHKSMPTADSPTLETVFFDYDRKPLSRHPMTCFAIYGKGGIGKSTTAANVALALAQSGKRVMLIGCDPKADSTALLRGDAKIDTVLSLLRTRHKSQLKLEEMVTEGKGGVLCVEAGGPRPGVGCAGRGIIAAFEALKAQDAFNVYRPDVVIFDVLGDVVCGGFAMPIRDGWAKNVFIVTSGENMAIHAAANIAMAVDTYAERGYARLGGLILNCRDVPREVEKVEELADDLKTKIVGRLPRSEVVQTADELGFTVLEHAPESEMAQHYRTLAQSLLDACAEPADKPQGNTFTF